MPEIAHLVGSLTRTIHSARAQLGKGHGVEPGSGYLLKILNRTGPQRTKDLADFAGVDISQVSRHVQTLVEQGFIERVADPGDGRAIQLRITAEGQAACEAIVNTQCIFFDRVFADWTEEERTTFEAQLARFVTDLNTEFHKTQEQEHAK